MLSLTLADGANVVSVSDVLGTVIVCRSCGAYAVRVSAAVVGVTTMLAIAVTVGANVVSVSAAVLGVTPVTFDAVTVGANLVSVSASVVGVAT